MLSNSPPLSLSLWGTPTGSQNVCSHSVEATKTAQKFANQTEVGNSEKKQIQLWIQIGKFQYWIKQETESKFRVFYWLKKSEIVHIMVHEQLRGWFFPYHKMKNCRSFPYIQKCSTSFFSQTSLSNTSELWSVFFFSCSYLSWRRINWVRIRSKWWSIKPFSLDLTKRGDWRNEDEIVKLMQMKKNWKCSKNCKNTWFKWNCDW